MPVALVTGASRGLGKEIALALRKNGYTVFVNHISAAGSDSELSLSSGGNAMDIRADVGDPVQVREMAELIEKEAGGLDVVINNAGITKDALLIRQSEEEWDSVMRTNLKGCFNIIKTMAPLMVKSGGGHIINISSRSGIKGKAGQAAYSASKSALLGLTYTSAAELAAYNIRVNAVMPGFMGTDMGMTAFRAMNVAKGLSLINRLSDPAEVAAMVLAILNTKNITGQVFSFDSRIL